MKIIILSIKTIHSQHEQRFNVQQQVTQQLIGTKGVLINQKNVQMFSTAVIQV